MRHNYFRLSISLLLLLFMAACNLPKGVGITPDSSVATKVSLTQEGMTQIPQQNQTTLPGSPTSGLSTITRTPGQQITKTTGPTETTSVTQSPTRTSGPTASLTPTLQPTNTPIPDPGTIAGNIYGYPYGSVPSLAIVAFGQEPPNNYSYWITGYGVTYFAMTSQYLIPGHYQVVAYDAAGHAGGCTTQVLVVSNQTVNCDITDWGGGYPPKPSGVPSP
jgi:hypothetical protein